MKKTLFSAFLITFAFLIFSVSANSAVVVVMGQNRDKATVAMAASLEMPILVRVLRAAESKFSLTSKWYAELQGLYARRKDTAGWLEYSNALTVYIYWNGSYEVYCGVGKSTEHVVKDSWENLLETKHDRKDPCRNK